MSPVFESGLRTLVHGRVYRIHSRNLDIGVWREDVRGFIGIRTKFQDRFLFTEFHWDNGPPFGTAWAEEDLGIDVPAGMPLLESLGAEDKGTGRPVGLEPPENRKSGHWPWFFADTGERDPDRAIRPVVVRNQALFTFLDGIAGGE